MIVVAVIEKSENVVDHLFIKGNEKFGGAHHISEHTRSEKDLDQAVFHGGETDPAADGTIFHWPWGGAGQQEADKRQI